ncbi:MAG: anaerobic ribonucleoside-triphosphate reductase activating protein [Halobacteriota archaeon]|nr:anaerobic ribonucleoside-triphosphate reductase activating protein [Halobacteriota archaeon]
MKDKVNFGGVISVSTVDWYGKSVSVIFFRRCPLSCPYCQNHTLLEGDDYRDLDEIKEIIRKSSRYVDGVVFTGGEPFGQYETLKQLSEFAKGLFILVGIETNGYYPDRTRELLLEGLVDKIFLDIKAPLTEPRLYEEISGARDIVDRIKKTLEICNGNVDLELRTTVFRGLIGADEVEKIARSIENISSEYVIQQGLPDNAYDEKIRDTKEYDMDELINIAKSATKHLKTVKIRSKEPEISISSDIYRDS